MSNIRRFEIILSGDTLKEFHSYDTADTPRSREDFLIQHILSLQNYDGVTVHEVTSDADHNALIFTKQNYIDIFGEKNGTDLWERSINEKG